MKLEDLKNHYTVLAVISQDPIRNFGTMNACCEVLGIRYGISFFGIGSIFAYRLKKDFVAYDRANPFEGEDRISPKALESKVMKDADWKVLNTEGLTDRIMKLIEVAK